MSGHSKWATIHRQKGINDAKRGQAFTKLAKAITMAVGANGNPDPGSNFKLRLAIEKARAMNMPKENIQRAITRATGEGGANQWEEIVYEGYGPGGIAVVVEATTDNKQRTAQEVKNAMEKGGGNLAGPGSVSYQFERKGLLTVEKSGNVEEQILQIMDLGVDDVEEAEDALELYAQPEVLEEVKKKVEEAGFTVSAYELILQPTTTVSITDQAIANKVVGFMKRVEDLDDVQKVFSNFDIPDELLNQAGI